MEDQRPQLPSPVIPDYSAAAQPTFIERYGISLLLFTFVSLLLIFFLYQIIGGVITLLIYGMKLTDENLSGYRIATGIGQLIFILIPTLFLVRLVTHKPAEYLRFQAPSILAILTGFVGIFSLQQVLQIYLVFQEKIPLPSELQSMMQKFKDMFDEMYRQLVGAHTSGEFIFVLVVVAFIPAITEELMFRGLIQRNLERALTPVSGMIITGIIFAGYHLNPFSFIPLVIIGIYLGFLAMRSRSIWVSIAAHFFNNALAVASLFINVEDDYVVFGNSSKMSLTSLLGTFWFFGLIFILTTLYFIKITKPAQKSSTDEQQISM